MLLTILGRRQREDVFRCLLGELRVMRGHALMSAMALATRTPSIAALAIPPA